MFAVPPLDYWRTPIRCAWSTSLTREDAPRGSASAMLTLSPVAGVPKTQSAIVKANRNGKPPRPLPN